MANRKFEFDTDGFQYYNDNYVKHPSKSATTGTSGAHPYNGMGRVVLKKNMVSNVNTLTQAMVSTANTIYVIQYDFTLGENITVPANCVLEFDGGSIGGAYTVTLQDTYIEAPNKAIFNMVSFSGTILNDSFNALWVAGNDIGARVNVACEDFDRVYVPYNTYAFTTPINVANMKMIDLRGVYKYNGSISNNLALIKISKSSNGILSVGELTVSSSVKSQMSYADNRNINVIGVNFNDTSFARFFVKRVSYLNEAIRISSIESEHGAGDNFLDALTLINNNIGVRLYQQDATTTSKIQFINDTHIRINYISYWDDIISGTKYGIYIAGPLADPASYRPSGVTDSYDECTGVVCDGGDYENMDIGFYTRQAELSINDVREEHMVVFLKAVRRLKLHYQPKYYNSIDKMDLSECTNFVSNGLPEVIDYQGSLGVLKKTPYSTAYIFPYNYHMLRTEGSNKIDDTPRAYNNFTSIGWIISNYVSNIFFIDADVNGAVNVAFLDENNNNITGNYTFKNNNFYKASDNVLYGNDLRHYWIQIPSGVSKVFIGTNRDRTKCSIKISSFNKFDVDNNPVVLEGTTRPEALPSHIPFFDKSLTPAKPIWCTDGDGNGNIVWVDATGTPL